MDLKDFTGNELVAAAEELEALEAILPDRNGPTGKLITAIRANLAGEMTRRVETSRAAILLGRLLYE